MRKTMPVAQRVLGKLHEITIKMLWAYVETLYEDDNATLDDLRKAVNTLEDAARDARRVYGSAHPFAEGCEFHLQKSRAVLAARETPSPSASIELKLHLLRRPELLDQLRARVVDRRPQTFIIRLQVRRY